MFILITNDDGIDDAGLRALVRAARSHGHRVIVCAPKEQQSAASHRIQLNMPILVHKHEDIDGAEAWAISGTPADCVRMAMELTPEKPDVCFSGINYGENAGSAVYYSGTVAAAREAAMHHIPAFAVSIMLVPDRAMMDALAEKAIIMAENTRLDQIPRQTLVSINAPALPPSEWKGMRYAPISKAYYQDRYEQRVSPRGQRYFWLGNGLPMEPPEPDSDYDLLYKGYITVSVIGGFEDLNPLAERFLPSL